MYFAVVNSEYKLKNKPSVAGCTSISRETNFHRCRKHA